MTFSYLFHFSPGEPDIASNRPNTPSAIITHRAAGGMMNGEVEEVRVGDLYYPGLSLYAIHVSPPVQQDAPGHLQVFTKMTLLCLAGGLSVSRKANPGAIRKYIRRKLQKTNLLWRLKKLSR